eukprot:jgi/Hompol1/6241/HPOL_004900-RA
MASDITRWGDHARILVSGAEGYIAALYALKRVLDLENGPSADILMRGGTPDMAFGFNGTPFTLEATARPTVERLSIFVDSSIVGLQSKLVKKFPDYGDLGKNLPSFQNGHREIIEGLRPHYKLLAGVSDFMDLSIAILQMASRFTLLTTAVVVVIVVVFSGFQSDINPELMDTFIDLFINVVSIAYLTSSIGPEVKLIAFAYNRAYQSGSGGPDSPEWFRVTKLLTTYDNPAAALQESLSSVATRMITMIINLRPDIEQVLSSSVEQLRNNGTLCIVPDLFGVRAGSQPSDRFLVSLINPMRLFKFCMFGILVAPIEAYQQFASLDVLKTAFTYGYLAPTVRNE